jgi:hypothetical protein
LQDPVGANSEEDVLLELHVLGKLLHRSKVNLDYPTQKARVQLLADLTARQVEQARGRGHLDGEHAVVGAGTLYHKLKSVVVLD